MKKLRRFSAYLTIAGLSLLVGVMFINCVTFTGNGEAKSNATAQTVTSGTDPLTCDPPPEVINSVEPEMVMVEGGAFKMGSTKEKNEMPVHDVKIDGFRMSKFDITVAQFSKFVAAAHYRTSSDNDGFSTIWTGTSVEKKDGVNWRCGVNGEMRREDQYNNPVIFVSWDDADAYCKWLSKTTGKAYSLPTEAQWEYAARGGNKTHGYLYSGSDNIDDVAWYEKNSGDKTHTVGQKRPNELGIYDMSGNVWQWCADWYAEDYAENNMGVKNPTGPSRGQNRVLRGGSWYYFATGCRVSYRYDIPPSDPGYTVGFRVVSVP